jgi:hypothetical protein
MRILNQTDNSQAFKSSSSFTQPSRVISSGGSESAHANSRGFQVTRDLPHISVKPESANPIPMSHFSFLVPDRVRTCVDERNQRPEARQSGCPAIDAVRLIPESAIASEPLQQSPTEVASP